MKKLSFFAYLCLLASVTVTGDSEPPTLASASGSGTFTTVRVVFSEPLDESSAETAGNYALSEGVTVSAAALALEAGTAGDDTVVLTTSRQPEGTVLTLTVNNVKDAAGDNTIAADSTIDFKTHVWISGVALHEKWNQIDIRVPDIGPHEDPDETFRELETLADFPDNPDESRILSIWEAPSGIDNQYVAQISGWLSPAETGGYVFFTNSDDPSHLYLSTDDDPANKLLIAQQIQWSGVRNWQTGNQSFKRSDEFFSNYPNEGVTDPEHEYDVWPEDGFTDNSGILLEAGRRYYMEAIFREGNGGDNLEVTMITEDEAEEEGFPPNGTASTLTGDLIGTYLNPNGAEVTITQQPQDASVLEDRAVTFTVEAEGTHAYGNSLVYQWQSAAAGSSDFADIAGATGTSYTTELLMLEANNRQYRVMIGAPAFQIVSATSEVVTLSVNPDNDPPTLASASGSDTFTTVRVVFSEPLDESSAETAGNYALSGGVTVSAAALALEAGTAGDDTVVLTTSRQPEGTVLTLTVNNVQDAAGNNAIVANSTIDFKTHTWVTGGVLVKKWNNFTGNNGDPAIAIDQNLLADPRFPGSPDEEFVVTRWEFPPGHPSGTPAPPANAAAAGVSSIHDSYASQIVGWFLPEETDDYVFFTVSDDPSKLYLSPDDDPANKLLIAQQVGWAPVRQWQDGDDAEKQARRSDLFENAEWDNYTSNWGISLEAGERYYMESLHTEGGGGDNVAVTYLTEDEALSDENAPANGTIPRLTGDLIGTYLNPNGIEVTITNQPSDATVISGLTATFSVVAGATSYYGNTIDYQWQSADTGSSNFADIEGATADSYTTDPLLRSDNGRQYRVVIGAPVAQLHSVNSDAATLTVNPDEVFPEIVSVFPLQRNNVVVVLFDERLDESSAETAGNYTISGASVSAAELVGDGGNVVKLTVSGTPSADFTVTATGVQDFSGNAITSSEGVAVSSDVVVYWDFDDASDETTATDLVRSAVGELTGDAVFTDDRDGRSGQAGDRAVDLGTYGGGQHVLVEPANWLNGYPAQLNQITFSFWQRWTENINNQSSFWAVSTGSSSGNRGAQAHTPWGNGEIYFDTAGCCGGATQRINLASGFDQVDWEEWIHFAFVKDGDYKAIYVNGELFHEGNNTNPLPADFVRLMIGSDGNGGNSHGGLIDDFAVFTTPLSVADIEELADGMRPDEIRTIVPIIDPSGLSISVRLNGDGTVTIEFTGTLHSSDSITGTFEPVEGATSPYTVSIVSGPVTPPTPGQPEPEPTAVDPQKFYLVR